MRTPPVSLGEILELSPDALVAGGEAICRIDGFPLFVSGIYPGDLARVEVVVVTAVRFVRTPTGRLT